MSRIDPTSRFSNENLRPVPSAESEQPPTPRSHTAFLSKLIGLYMILIALPMLIQKQATIEIMNSIMRNPALLFLTGGMGMVAGVALILAHNVWSRGTLPVMVTLVGWLAAFKGVSLLFLATSPRISEAALAVLRYERFFYVYTGFTILLGMYFTVMGFRRGEPAN